MRAFRLFPASFLLLTSGILAISGCQGIGPVEPTLAILPTETPRPSPTAGPEVTVPIPTLPPTWTPLSTIPPRPTAPLLPSYTVPPPTATLDVTAAVPIAVTVHERGERSLLLTESQINAALARHFDAAPLDKYTSAPRISLGDGALTLTLHIVPLRAPANTGPQTITLSVALTIYAGALEFQPRQDATWDPGVTTKQIKLGDELLRQTLTELVNTEAGAPHTLTYNYINITRSGIALTVVPHP